jgi:queuine/archaeosine tRNA-ribosyltransferase
MQIASQEGSDETSAINRNKLYLVRKQKGLDSDAMMIINRVGKLKQIETKMLKKIDKTRQEAEKVRQVKQKNNERLEQKI